METWAIRLIVMAWVITVPALILLRSGLLEYRVPFYTIVIAVLIAAIGLILLLLSMVMGVVRGNGLNIGTIGFVSLSLVLVAPAVLAIKEGASVPMIHDISTDLEQPLLYEKVLSLRADSDNSLELSETVMTMQKEHYTNISPLELVGEKSNMFAKSIQQAEAMGWEVVSQDLERGHIEAVVATRIMGFRDDVVIRIGQQDDKVRVDIRSASRVGQTDLGANAARIVAFLDGLSSTAAN